MLNEFKNENENDESEPLKQIQETIEGGIIASINGKHAIHCLTIIGHIVIINNDKLITVLHDI